MAVIKVVDMNGKEVGEMNLADEIFAADINEAVLHTAVKAYLANQRQGTQSTLTRTEVSGGGKKPWKQKGTGRARQGSTRAPQWTHGGIALGPKPREYRVSLNKKTKRIAIFSALSSKVAAGEMVVVDKIAATEYKTAAMASMVKALGAGKKSLIVMPEVNSFVVKSCANIPGVKTTMFNTFSAYDVLNCNTLIVAKEAVEKIQEVYAK